MGATLRALRALVLLSGFYLVSLVLLAALAGADIALFHWGLHGFAAIKITIITVLLAVPVVRGMFMLRIPAADDPAAVEVGEADEPRLWALVREVADASGSHAPARILLTAEVNASVREDARLLGLRPGPHTLTLGVPLLTGLSEAQLRAVLGHEYGHFTAGDTRLSAIVVRGRARISRVVEQFHATADGKVADERERQERTAAKRIAKGKKAREVDTRHTGALYRGMARLYTWYAGLYLRASLSTARGQEFAADLAAVRIAGRDVTASALREIPVLVAAHGFYLETYATLGLPARTLPPRGQFFGGFREFLAARSAGLQALRAELPEEPESRYDSHPPMAERVRRIETLPADGRRSEGDGPALALLTDPEHTLTALEEATLTVEALGFRRTVDWPELMNVAMAEGITAARTPLHRALTAYNGRPATLADLLDAIDEGRLWRVAERLPLSEEAAAAKGRAFRQFVRPALGDSLRTMVLAEFSARSLLSWEFSWSRPATVRLPGTTDGAGASPEDAMEAAVDAALADVPDTAPLRALLPPTVVQPV
ncbi:M48 family metalloprotease [Streptomyces sp. NPDC048410]|uniref:M48 family metalloprotease n=1 Tax=Streptomyces sp. NPDC048410 TaxID=3365545 RepID=UPI00371BAB88